MRKIFLAVAIGIVLGFGACQSGGTDADSGGDMSTQDSVRNSVLDKANQMGDSLKPTMDSTTNTTDSSITR